MQTVCVKLTFFPHAHADALFEPALLALPSHVHVYVALAAELALINCLLRDRTSEET